MLTEFEKSYKAALLKLTGDVDEIYSIYICLQTDEARKKVIDGINNGSISSIDEIDEIIIEMCPKI